MFSRRDLFRLMGGVLGFGLVSKLSGCGSGASFEATVHALDDGASVYQATSRYYRLGVEARGWQNAGLTDLRKVVSVNGVVSDRWVFEIDGTRHEGSADAATATRVHAGSRIVWREA